MDAIGAVHVVDATTGDIIVAIGVGDVAAIGTIGVADANVMGAICAGDAPLASARANGSACEA